MVSPPSVTVTGPGVDSIHIDHDNSFTCSDMLALNILLDAALALKSMGATELVVLSDPTIAFTDPAEFTNLPVGRGLLDCTPCTKTPQGFNLINTCKLLAAEKRPYMNYSRGPWSLKIDEFLLLFPERQKSLNVPTYYLNHQQQRPLGGMRGRCSVMDKIQPTLSYEDLDTVANRFKAMLVGWRAWTPTIQSWLANRFPTHEAYQVIKE